MTSEWRDQVRVTPSVWTEGGLAVKVHDLIGVRQRNGQVLLVLSYMKKPVLERDVANVLLCLLHDLVDEMLPGALPTALDAGRSEALTLPRNANKPACARTCTAKPQPTSCTGQWQRKAEVGGG
ncbi:hypothetical protein [Amycolatopsis nigrescens]|uniref:hypothetical protein n=1 Tax=Amycolatopsis nigrescens TaxID=381445 RepID=UPI0012FB45BF|nr:hypothetical protein [Amycolatopsis nigrescens]